MMAADAPPPAEIVVTGARLPDAQGDAAYSIVRVAPERLQDATTLDDALKSVPGFSLYRRTSTLGANPTTQGVSLRAVAGSGASRALITLDGVPQNDPFGGWVVWTALPSIAVGEASIVRGAGAGAYGAGALTGVVQLETPRSSPTLSADASASDLGFRQGQAAVAASLRTARIFIDAAGEGSNGWIPVRTGRGAVDRPLDLHAWTAAGALSQDLGPGTTAAARVAGFEEDRGAGVVSASSRASGRQASITVAHQPAPEELGWRLQGWVSASDLYNASATVSNSRDTSVPANVQYATPAVGWGGNAALRRDTTLASLELGADVRGATGESRELFAYSAALRGFADTRKSGGETLVAGAYVEALARVGRWLLTGGARADEWANSAAERVEAVRASRMVTLDDRAANRSGVLPSARLGVRRDLAPGLTWRSATYAGFRPATLNELHRPFRVGNTLTEANPTLEPERLCGVETGIDATAGAVSFDATVFYNRLTRAITNVTLASGPGTFPVSDFPGVFDTVPAGGVLRQRQNAGVVDAEGLEAEAVVQAVPDQLQVRAALAYTHSEVNGGDQAPQLTGLRPALTPRATATAETRWTPAAAASLTVDLRYESSRYDDDLNTLRLRPSLTVDVRAEYAFTPALSFFVAVDNLLDAAIQTAETADGIYSYDAPRLVRIGVRLRR